MKLYIPRDMFDNYHPSRLFLCTTGKKRIGELHNYETSLHGKWASYGELNFSINRTYVDILTGETKIHPLFDKAEGLRMVLVEGVGYFIIQDPDMVLSDKDTKTLSCFGSEYACAQKYLEQFYINTGEENSKEVIYLSSIYGDGYAIDERYKLATGEFDAYESYYIQQYSDSNSYIYEQIQVADEDVYNEYIAKNNDSNAQPHEKLYVRKYPNIRFYWPSKPELSLLHLIFEKIPEWSIGHVDATLWRKERKFSEDRVSVYDFIGNNVTDTFDCVVEWDTLTNTVNFYEEADDGVADDGTIQSRFKTDVYISKDNLASELNVRYSTDNIKTKLKVSGADNLDIREVNLGKNYIMNLDYYHNSDWMEPDLLEAYDDYLETTKKYSPEYTNAIQGWIAANNKWNDIMNAVPAEGNVVLVGDEFKKLYCIYGLYNSIKEFKEDTTYYVMNEDGRISEANPQPNADNFDEKIYYIQGDYATKEKDLIDKLTLYHVNEDIDGNKQDNILLRLKNDVDDVATLRVYNASNEATEQAKKNKPLYKIQISIVRSSTGTSEASQYRTLSDWINGDLRVSNTGSDGLDLLTGFKVSYIGTMGAYFVLAKDERDVETLEEYGVNLLKEKHDTYVTIFQTQTEDMFSQQDYQCIVQNENPGNGYDQGTKWLDTDSSPAKLYEYDGSGKWSVISAEVSHADKSNYENYQRYIDNYEKMVAVQAILLQKEKEATYWLSGYKVPNRTINYKNGDGDSAFYAAADAHFRTNRDAADAAIIARQDFSTDLIPMYTFTTTKAEGVFAVYLQGNVPYVSYVESQGINQAKMNAIAQLTELQNFFTNDQWVALSPLIREDEYSDDNFLLTGYESEEERLEICRELMEAATKELKTLSQPSLEFSMTMANILALPEFEPITSQFALGNFIRIELRPGIIKRARLLECTLNFDSLADFSCTFGNLVTTKSEVDLHAELLAQAVQAGKTVAAAASDWQRAVDKSNKLEEAISNGLQDAALQIGRASGQAQSWDKHGMYFRKFADGSTTQYDDEQIAIINNKIVFTNDGWKTSKAALGEFEIDIDGDGQNEKMYGLLADAVVSGYIKGSVIEGGSMSIGGSGGKFVVHEDGSVQILGPDNSDIYATAGDVHVLSKALRYQTELTYDGSTIFSKPGSSCIITCRVYEQNETTGEYEDITEKLKDIATFNWMRVPASASWTPQADDPYPAFNKLKIVNEDIQKNSQFSCQVIFDTDDMPQTNTTNN